MKASVFVGFQYFTNKLKHVPQGRLEIAGVVVRDDRLGFRSAGCRSLAARPSRLADRSAFGDFGRLRRAGDYGV